VGSARAAAALRGGAAPARGARIARVHPVPREHAQRKEGVGMQLTELYLDGENGTEAATMMFRGGARAAIG